MIGHCLPMHPAGLILDACIYERSNCQHLCIAITIGPVDSRNMDFSPDCTISICQSFFIPLLQKIVTAPAAAAVINVQESSLRKVCIQLGGTYINLQHHKDVTLQLVYPFFLFKFLNKYSYDFNIERDDWYLTRIILES